jgi:hypothetical protein
LSFAVSTESLLFVPGPASDCNPPTCTSCIAGLTDVFHDAQLVG